MICHFQFVVLAEESRHLWGNQEVYTRYIDDPADACIQGSTNGTNGIPILFKVLPMVPLAIPLVPMDDNGTIGSPLETNGTIGTPMVPLVTNGTIGKITNVTIGKTLNARGNIRSQIRHFADDDAIYFKVSLAKDSILLQSPQCLEKIGT